MNGHQDTLTVSLSGHRCGTLAEDSYGALSFTYEPSYDGIPLSLSMPVGLARYGDRVVRPFLMGLLPDDQGTRSSIGAPYGVSGDNPFRLLRIIGKDCPGAIQISDPADDIAPEDSHDYVELSEHDIEDRLAAIRQDAASAWIDNHASLFGHWSLGGCQAKLALRHQNGHWYECFGDAATTHILKPGVTGFDHQALCEYLSMRVAHSIGLPTAQVEYLAFGDERAIVIARYDRKADGHGLVHRIHQEDLCQAMGTMPSAKYAEQGGPTTPRIISLLSSTGVNARDNIYRFILYLFFNYLIGATDAHAKNHSILLAAKDDFRLAPLYDVASIAPYRSLAPRSRKPLCAALSIGGENRFGLVGARHIEKLVETNDLERFGMDSEMLRERFKMMAELIPPALSRELRIASDAGLEGANELAASFEFEVRAHCASALRQ